MFVSVRGPFTAVFLQAKDNRSKGKAQLQTVVTPRKMKSRCNIREQEIIGLSRDPVFG